MRRGASNGREQNVSVITALHAVTPFSEGHKPAGHAKNQSLTNWMVPYEGLPKTRGSQDLTLHTLLSPAKTSCCTPQKHMDLIHAMFQAKILNDEGSE